MKKYTVFFTLFIFAGTALGTAHAYEILNGPSQLIQYNASKAYEGYTLLSQVGTKKTYLIDMLGNVVHTWDHKTDPPGLHFVLLENGNILGNFGLITGKGPTEEQSDEELGIPQGHKKGITFGGRVTGLVELDWDGNVVWQYEPAESDGSLHHDFVRLPNGNTLVNAWEMIPYEEVIAAGRRADQTTERGVATDVIYEINPGGKIVWKWSAWEHRGTNSESHLDVNHITYVLPEHEENNPDWTHFNNVDYDPESDQLLVDSREFGELYIIDHKTGDILYRWGNPSAYGAGDPPTFSTPGDQILFGPHNANWIKEGLPGAGNILIFNNGWGRPPISYSSVIEMDPETGEIVWEYKSNSETGFASHHISGAQRLPNGNTFICSGNCGHLFEVTPEGKVVWEYINPVTGEGPKNWLEDKGFGGNNMLFRAHRYGPDYPALANIELKPQGRIVEEIKEGWKPRVDLTGATQPGAKVWEQIWK
jgi:outer membrane protein assembly factor BamB